MSDKAKADEAQEMSAQEAPVEVAEADSPTREKVELTVVDGDLNSSSTGVPGSVKRAQFAPLNPGIVSGGQGSMDMLLDVQLDLAVELGRTCVPVKDVLQFGPGSIVCLDKMAGEPVDVTVNGKLLARGEVVVVDESFGVRITEIVSQSERLSRIA
jgi:flagellar motor switch protein FliN/FliY